jgi:hypothetical protein
MCKTIACMVRKTEESTAKSRWGDEFCPNHADLFSCPVCTGFIPLGGYSQLLLMSRKRRKRGSLHPLHHTPSWRNAYLANHSDVLLRVMIEKRDSSQLGSACVLNDAVSTAVVACR